MVGISNWEKYVKQDPRFMRPEVDVLRGDKVGKYELGWTPKTDFKKLVKIWLKVIWKY